MCVRLCVYVRVFLFAVECVSVFFSCVRLYSKDFKVMQNFSLVSISDIEYTQNTVGLNLFAEIRDDNVKGDNVDKSAG